MMMMMMPIFTTIIMSEMAIMLMTMDSKMQFSKLVKLEPYIESLN